MTQPDTTIVAITTPHGTGGVAMVRLSGPTSWAIAQTLVQTKKNWLPGQVVYGWLVDTTDQQPMDEVLVLPFKGPHSFTGEDCVEIHCHGGLYLSKAVLQQCLQQGAQLAVAGEFTKRGVLNGRIDLTQAEAILDLIHAQGEAMVKLSAHNLRHRHVAAFIASYADKVMHIQASLTASIDFPDEVPEPERAPLAEELMVLATQMEEQIAISQRHQFLRDGLDVVLLGRPNSGKSSLFNALLSSDRSIVTAIEGTTRDVIRETVSVKGIPVTLVDTAGLRDSTDTVEQLGVERSRQALETAQAIVYVVDGCHGLIEEEEALLGSVGDKPGVVIWNKSDHADYHKPASLNGALPSWAVIETSALEQTGVTATWDWLESMVGETPDQSELTYLLSQRQMTQLTQVTQGVGEAAKALQNQHYPLDIATVPLTDALLELEALLGKDTREAVLDSVFSRFCVGK